MYPLAAETATVKVPDLPCTTLKVEAVGVKISVGEATVTALLAVPEKLPLVPVIAMFPAPTVAAVVVETVAVVLVPGFTLDGLNVTVTPLGAVAFNATESVNPVAAEIATKKVAV